MNAAAASYRLAFCIAKDYIPIPIPIRVAAVVTFRVLCNTKEAHDHLKHAGNGDTKIALLKRANLFAIVPSKRQLSQQPRARAIPCTNQLANSEITLTPSHNSYIVLEELVSELKVCLPPVHPTVTVVGQQWCNYMTKETREQASTTEQLQEMPNMFLTIFLYWG